MSETGMRDRALGLAAKGFRVFPLQAGGKAPELPADWEAIATTSREKVMDLWTDPVFGHDPGYNIGIALDPGTVVVDVDVRDGKRGAESLALLEMLHADLPATLEVTTASGGRHLYFRALQQNWVAKLAEHVDVKSAGGYVVAPGSIVDGREYAANGKAVADAPEWLLQLGHRPADRTPKVAAPLVDEDSADAIRRATQWLTDSAPDHGTYRVACRVKDFGVSQEMCLALMEEHWDQRLNLGKGPEHIAFRVANAYRYGQNPQGISSAQYEFEGEPIPDTGIPASAPTKPGKAPLLPGRIDLDDLAVPPRQWLYGNKLSRKYTAFVGAPGGLGKTAWVTGIALACASGRKLLHDKPHHPMRVWLYNLEDDILELRRRIAAGFHYHELPPETLGNLRVNSGRERGLTVVKQRDDTLVVMPDTRELIARMTEERIELLIVDPFLRSHSVPENATEAQDEVMRVYNHIAEQTNAAIVLVHHTRKGAAAGDAEGLRGSGTQSQGARSVFMLSNMTPEESQRLGIPEDKRRLHVRIDDPKKNMSPPAITAEWIKLASVQLDNRTPDYPQGDSVQVARPWTPPDPLEALTPEQQEEALAEIAAGLDDEQFSARPQDDRWAGQMLMDRFGIPKEAARAAIAAWLGLGVIETRDYESARQRKTRKGLFVKDRSANEDQA